MAVKKRMKTNPFKPTAGAEPPVLVGRDHVIDDFIDGLDEGVGAPGRLMRITGPRGSGKTVLLTELGDIARKRGWLVVDVTAREGMLGEVIAMLSDEDAIELSADIDLGIVKAHASTGQKSRVSIREALTKATGSAAGRTGVLVTVDEAQDADRDRRHVDGSLAITMNDVRKGAMEADREFCDMVILPALSGVSKRGVEYLIKMAKVDGAISTAAIAQYLGVKPSALSSTRRTLISKQIIEPTARGYVTFSIPRMREYVREFGDELMGRFGT